MDKDQVKGRAKETTGEIKEHLGRALGDRDLEGRGHAQEQQGKLQKDLGDVKEATKDKLEDITGKNLDH